MKRRDFVLTAVAVTGAVAIPTAYYFLKDVGYDNLLAQPQSLSLIWDAEAIKLIGNQYRADFPDEKSVRTLVSLLDTPSKAGESIASGFNERITNDFETGKTVLVDGWILSVTEARQCALASTVQSK